MAHGADSRCPAPSLSQRFPRTIQTIEFIAHSDNQLLHTRTSDGLPLTLGLSFQYRYIPEHLHTLPPGEAFRVRGLLFARSPTANAFGSYRVEWDGGEGVDAEVGVLGLSSDGAPVRDYRPEEDQE